MADDTELYWNLESNELNYESKSPILEACGTQGPIIIVDEDELNKMKEKIKADVMLGVKFYLINVRHFCLRDPASLDWRNNKLRGFRLIQTSSYMLPLFQIFENELKTMGYRHFILKCKFCSNMRTFEALQRN